MKKLKILVCVAEYPPYYSSGIGNCAYYLVDQLKKRGVDCVVCSPAGSDIEFCNGSIIKKFANFYVGGIRPIYGTYFWYRVNKYLKTNSSKYNIVWIHNPPSFLLKNILESTYNKNLITKHSTSFIKIKKKFYSKKRLSYWFMLWIIGTAEKRSFQNRIIDGARFTAVSPEVTSELEAFGIDHKKIKYIPNGVDINRFKPVNDIKMLRKKFGIPEDGLVILSLGRLTEVKQPLKLIEVFSMIEKEMKDITLVIAGKGELLEDAKELVKQKKLAKVRFLGYVNHEKEAPGLYACSDYFIMASKYEGAEPILTLAEAMASGLPCIVSDIPNFRFIERIKSGIIVDFSDVEKAAKNIINYLERDNSEHSKNAMEYAVKNLDWKVISERYLEEFKKLWEGKKG